MITFLSTKLVTIIQNNAISHTLLNDNNLVIVGLTRSYGSGDSDLLVMKINTNNGNIICNKHFVQYMQMLVEELFNYP